MRILWHVVFIKLEKRMQMNLLFFKNKKGETPTYEVE